jgi:subtilisin family serine protease
MAMGHKTTVIGTDGYVKTGNGTSFSGPLIAGFVACLKQAHPTMTNDRLFKAIIMSADRYNKPDTAYGFGIPNILKADSILKVMARIDKVESAVFRAYPNPGNNLLTIDSKELIEQVTILTTDGRIVLQSLPADQLTSVSLNTENLAEGIYLIQVRTISGSGVLRWICSDAEKK